MLNRIEERYYSKYSILNELHILPRKSKRIVYLLFLLGIVLVFFPSLIVLSIFATKNLNKSKQRLVSLRKYKHLISKRVMMGKIFESLTEFNIMFIPTIIAAIAGTIMLDVVSIISVLVIIFYIQMCLSNNYKVLQFVLLFEGVIAAFLVPVLSVFIIVLQLILLVYLLQAEKQVRHHSMFYRILRDKLNYDITIGLTIAFIVGWINFTLVGQSTNPEVQEIFKITKENGRVAFNISAYIIPSLLVVTNFLFENKKYNLNQEYIKAHYKMLKLRKSIKFRSIFFTNKQIIASISVIIFALISELKGYRVDFTYIPLLILSFFTADLLTEYIKNKYIEWRYFQIRRIEFLDVGLRAFISILLVGIMFGLDYKTQESNFNLQQLIATIIYILIIVVIYIYLAKEKNANR